MRLIVALTYLLTGLMAGYLSIVSSLGLLGLAEPSQWWYSTIWQLVAIGAPLLLIAAGLSTFLGTEFDRKKGWILASIAGLVAAYGMFKLGAISIGFVLPMLLAVLISTVMAVLMRRPPLLALIGSLLLALFYLLPFLSLFKSYILFERIPLQSRREIAILAPVILIGLSLYFSLRRRLWAAASVSPE